MLGDSRIHLWLESVPDHLESNRVPSRKRKPSDQLTPPRSVGHGNAMDTTPTTKRQRTGDNDPTPRAKSARTGSYASSLSSVSLPPSQQPTSTSSPRRQLRGLRLDVGGLECRQIEEETIPPAAASLFQDLLDTAVGIDILPRSKKTEIIDILQKEGQEGQPVRRWKAAFMDEEHDTFPGLIPSWEDLEIIMKRAKKCRNFDHEEASWNMEVHHRLLDGVFRNPKSAVPEPFDFMSCTTARPHRTYLPCSIRQKMVDFCLFDNSGLDVGACETFARRTITQTVNHTEYSALQLSPIVLSIETKRHGKDLDVAQLQMGVWHAAQWKFLQSAVEVMARSRQPEGASDEAIADAAKGTLAELGFLPGVIIQGHRWYFVFSTVEPHTTEFEDGTNVTALRTILWTELEFGSTETILKMYQIVAGLRRLSKWAQDVYVPWFRRHVLRRRTLD